MPLFSRESVYVWETVSEESTVFPCSGWKCELWYDLWGIDAVRISSLSGELVGLLSSLGLIKVIVIRLMV